MKKTLAILMAVLMLSTMFVACSGPATPEVAETTEAPAAPEVAEATTMNDVISIGVSMDNLDDPFWIGIKTGIEAAAKELGENANVDLQVCQGDANLQAKQIQDMITAGADAIVCVYVDSEAIKQSVKLCNEKGIPFIYCDRTLESSDDAKVDWGIATDNYALTKNGWEYMAEYAKTNNIQWKVLELAGALTDNNVLKRSEGFKTVMDANSDIIELVQTVPTEWNLEKTLAGVTNALQANPEINIIFMHSDYLLAPTIQALQQANRYVKIGEEGHVALMPYSGAKSSLEAMQGGYAEMCFGMDVYAEGYESVMTAFSMAKGEAAPGAPKDDAGFIITQDNFSEMAPRAYGSF